LRDLALKLLDRSGVIWDIAKELSDLMRRQGIPRVVIGGIAVVLHGHLRTTKDIVIFLDQPLQTLADHLIAAGFQFDPKRREFVREAVPVHVISRDQVGRSPKRTVQIDGITTVSLVDLIAMKLESGSANVLRAQDLADVVGLIRRNGLSAAFARNLEKPLRPTYLKLVQAIQDER
jgi:hypothetical protein